MIALRMGTSGHPHVGKKCHIFVHDRSNRGRSDQFGVLISIQQEPVFDCIYLAKVGITNAYQLVAHKLNTISVATRQILWHHMIFGDRTI